MSTKRELLLSDEQIATKCNFMCYPHESIAVRLCTSLRDMYEAARAKDAELAQRLLDGYVKLVREMDAMNSDDRGAGSVRTDLLKDPLVAAANEAGFKPSDQ